MSIQQQQLDGSLSPPELDLLHNVTGAVATLVSRLFKTSADNCPCYGALVKKTEKVKNTHQNPEQQNKKTRGNPALQM
eukprot:1147378-Pelagomonas_calceolata.AAC.1